MSETLLRTPLFDAHVALGAKMVPFAGFEMPVQYPAGITAEHTAVRTAAGLFDVSHMGEFFVGGPDALDFVQHISVNDASKIAVGQAQYSAMCLDDGGILDDLVIYRFPEYFMLVVNGARRSEDWSWVSLQAQAFEVELEDRSDEFALLALQGPKAASILEGLSTDGVHDIGYYRFEEGAVAGIDCVISRTGYTGEDGFELYIPSEHANAVWNALLESGQTEGLMPAGLGSRDSLRLEMGYALYGNDLDEGHTPLEGRLGWLTKLQKGEFCGRSALLAQKEQGVERRLVGLRLTERGFPRPGYSITHQGADVGVVTSGTVGPSVGHGIAMGYVPAEFAPAGTELGVRIRDKVVPAVVESPPFYREGTVKK